jgi:large subunit ribosomal protein L21
MYAIVRTGGKQYTVRAGDTLRVEKLEKELGAEFNMDEVLLIGGDKVHVGEPMVSNAQVTVVVTQQAKSPKVIVFKKKRRQGYRRLKGHRQLFTELFVKTIKSPSGEVSEAEQKAAVIDPVRIAAREEAWAAKQAAASDSAPGAEKATKTKKAVPVKKAAAKSAGAKKTGKAKSAGAKKAPAKKAAKK